jgi:hypothetical protein
MMTIFIMPWAKAKAMPQKIPPHIAENRELADVSLRGA